MSGQDHPSTYHNLDKCTPPIVTLDWSILSWSLYSVDTQCYFIPSPVNFQCDYIDNNSYVLFITLLAAYSCYINILLCYLQSHWVFVHIEKLFTDSFSGKQVLKTYKYKITIPLEFARMSLVSSFECSVSHQLTGRKSNLICQNTL